MSDRSACWFCKHFLFTPGERGYSEWTPGSQAAFDCLKDVWEIDLEDETEETFRQKLSTAATCPKFETRG